ncbi:MAG: glutathionylspermidine synthase family protein [Alphaproteobacteria bacterium]
MKRLAVTPRHDWRATAERLGFTFHTMYGEPYWDESACYVFSLSQIEHDIEDPTAELMAMCYAVVERAVGDEEVLHSLAIPETWWQPIRDSWQRGDRDLYARFDLSYDGREPARLLECNGDTPTSLYEAAFFQWLWLEQALERGIVPPDCDQFNSLQEALIDAFTRMWPDHLVMPGSRTLHLTSVGDNDEDHGTILYLEDCAHQAGLATTVIDIEAIGVDAAGHLTDLDDRVIKALFKLYPWEFLVHEPFEAHLRGPGAPLMLEPCWKMVLSNKGLLPWLWRMFPDHPNLLPSWFANDPGAAAASRRHVVKPLLSREGANVRLVDPDAPGGGMVVDGPYGAEGFVVQDLHPLPVFRGEDGRENHAVVGSWIVAGRPHGLGMREDDGPITVNTSRFVPHVIR